MKAKHRIGIIRRSVLFFCWFTASIYSFAAEIVWGERVEGFSVGLQFSNSTFSATEAVFATVYLRNESDTPQSFAAQPAPWLLSFSVSDARREQLTAKPANMAFSGVKGFPLLPGSTHVETVDLRDYLYLTNVGDLTVTARRKVGRSNVALSGNVTINITNTTANNDARPIATETLGSAGISSVVPGLLLSTSVAERAANPMMSPQNPKVPADGSHLAAHLATPPTLAIDSQTAETKLLTPSRKVGIGILVGLLGFLTAIVWRAARRKAAS